MPEETVQAKKQYRLEKVEYSDPDTGEWKTIRYNEGLKNAVCFMGTLMLSFEDDHREILGTPFRITERAVLVPVEPVDTAEASMAVGGNVGNITATCDQPTIIDRDGNVTSGKEEK